MSKGHHAPASYPPSAGASASRAALLQEDSNNRNENGNLLEAGRQDRDDDDTTLLDETAELEQEGLLEGSESLRQTGSKTAKSSRRSSTHTHTQKAPPSSGRYAQVGRAEDQQLFLGLQPRTAILLLIAGIAGLVILYKTVVTPAVHGTSVSSWSEGGVYTPATVPHHPHATAHMAGVGSDWSNVIDEKLSGVSHDGKKSNGSHWFDPTVIIISLDGVRADYLERGLTPHLLDIAHRGLRAKYMQPIFPTLTFPNHWAMQTGLYAESHGIVANDFWDPVDDSEFLYTDSSKSWQTKWWSGEPMWRTATKNGLKSANLMWPGPPQMADHASPTYFQPFMNNIDWQWKLNMLTEWVDLPDDKRPQLIMGYLPDVDQEGHHTGPDSAELRAKLTMMDNFAKALMEYLEDRHLTDIIDVIFVSDHGMTATSNERVVYLDDLLGEEGFKGITHKIGWPSCGLTFADHVNESDMIERMKNGALASNGGFAYYTPDTMPPEWHYSSNPRISPHWLVPEVGWAISDKHEHFYEMKGQYIPLGNHGYNNSHPDMHAIFVHHGPASSRIKSNINRRDQVARSEVTIIDGFENVELYNLVMDKLLGARQLAPNNGTSGFWDRYLDDPVA